MADKKKKKKGFILSFSGFGFVGESLNQQKITFNLKKKSVTHFHLVYGHILWAVQWLLCRLNTANVTLNHRA